MKFKEWIKTQDRNRWNLDAPTVSILESWFRDRVIFSAKKMERVFWMTLSLNRQHYLDMRRIQDSNHNFDPGITRVLEAVFEESGAETLYSHNSHSNVSNSSSSDTVKHIGNDVVREEENTNAGIREESETLSFEDRAKERSKSGEVSREHDAKPVDNYSQDSGKDTTGHIKSEATTVRNSGRHITENDNKVAEKGVQASKSAPMTAVGLNRNGSGGIGAYAEVKSGSLGAQDWSSASSYGERSGETGTTGKTIEYYEGDNTITRTEGEARANYDDTEYGKKTSKSEHYTDKEKFLNYKEIDTDKGSEIRDKTSQPYEDHKDSSVTTTIADVVNSGSGNVSASGSGSTTGNNSHSRLTKNIYSGREGLTPQEAFASAIKYLQDYPDAIYWLISQLETCFIGIIDDEYDEEDEDE